MRPRLFELGQINITSGAMQVAQDAHEDLSIYLLRHSQGDWGDMPLADRALNEKALKYGGRLRSAYRLTDSTEIWIITEAGLEATNVLVPGEY